MTRGLVQNYRVKAKTRTSLDMLSLAKDVVVKTSITGQPGLNALAAFQLVVKVLKAFSEGERVRPVARQADGSP